MKKSILIMISIIILSVNGAKSESYYCTSCLQCSEYIQNSSSGDIVMLDTSITGFDGGTGHEADTCIRFNLTENIKFDCSGFAVSGDGDVWGYGISLINSSNNTIRNCNNISYFSDGIHMSWADNNTVQNVTSINNTGNGIELANSHNNTLSSMLLADNDGDILIQFSDNNTISNITTLRSYWISVYALYSESNTFYNISILDNEFGGLHLDFSHFNNFSNITVASDSQLIAVHIADSGNNTFTNTSITALAPTPENDQAGFYTSRASIVGVYTPYFFSNNVDESVTVNGRPVKYFDGYYNPCPDDQIIEYNDTYSQVTLLGCNNVTLSNTTLDDSLILIGTNNSSFYNVDVNFSTIELSISHNNTLVNTSARGATYEEASFILIESDSNTIINSIARYFGFYIHGKNNTLTRISSYNTSYGIHLYRDSDFNIINDSVIEESTLYGIYLHHWSTEYPENNMVYNCYLNNSINFKSSTVLSNHFNTSRDCSNENIVGGSCIGGNYWTGPGGNFSDSCKDEDADGICDSQLNLSGDGACIDYLPLGADDSNYPNVILNLPSDGNFTALNQIIFNCSADDDRHLKNITLWGNWSGGWHGDETVNITGTTNSTLFTKTIADGTYIWNCRVCDAYGNCNWSASNFTITITSSISSCQILDVENKTYYLTDDVNTTGTCFTVSANNVSLNCQNHTIIYGNQTGGTYYGIYSSYNETSIKNCTVFRGGLGMMYNRYGVYLTGSNNSVLEHINASNNTNGIRISSGQANVLSNITANNCTSYGIYLEEGSGNILVNITADSNWYGIYLDSSPGNQVLNSSLSGNARYDLYVTGDQCSSRIESVIGSGGRDISYYNHTVVIEDDMFSELFLCNASYSVVDNVTVSGPYKNNGLFVSETNHSSFTQIDSSGNYYGIYFSLSSNNTLEDITASSNSYYGIHLSVSSNNTLANITANSNYYGIRLGLGSSNNNLVNVTANLNFDFGILLLFSSSNNTLSNITVDSSNRTGIEIVQQSTRNTIQNLNMWNCSALGGDGCIYILSPENNIVNAYINKSSNNGIKLYAMTGNANDNLFQGITMENIDGYDVYLEANAQNSTFLNVSYDDEGVNSGCELTRVWYVGVNVTNSTGNPLENINVSIYNSSLHLTDYNETQSSGMTPAFELTEYINTGGVKSYWTNYTLYAKDSAGTYQNHTSSFNFTTNILIEINMTEIDKTPPEIYNVTNGSVYPAKAYILWNTSEPANSTVLFGTNETSLTSSIGDTSFSTSHIILVYWLTKNTTYHYNVTSCDAAGNCNSSGTYNFTTPYCTVSWSCGSWSSCSGGQKTRTCSQSSQCEYPFTRTESESCSSGGGGGPPAPDNNVTKEFRLIPGVGLRNNTKLQASIERVLNRTNTSQQARENMLMLSESITSDISTTRWFINMINKSKIQTIMKYNGTMKVRSFIVFEYLPKSFSANATRVIVTAPGASIMIVEEDPSWIITYPELNAGDEILITYEVDGSRSSSVIDGMISEIYAESLENETSLEKYICTPGAKRCYGGSLEQCSPEGLEWRILEICTNGCEAETLACKKSGTDAGARPLADISSLFLIAGLISFAMALIGGSMLLSILKKTRKKKRHKMKEIKKKDIGIPERAGEEKIHRGSIDIKRSIKSVLRMIKPSLKSGGKAETRPKVDLPTPERASGKGFWSIPGKWLKKKHAGKMVVLPKGEQKRILEKTIEYAKKDLLPNPKINAIAIYGSLISGKFGGYVKPQRGRIYSDIGILILVDDSFIIPFKWKSKICRKTPTHNVYNIRLIDGKYLMQYTLVPRSVYQNPIHQKTAEQKGVPLKLSKSRNKHVILYLRD